MTASQNNHPGRANNVHILYVAEATSGGIFEYGICQANALSRAGARVTYLCRAGTDTSRLTGVDLCAKLAQKHHGGPSKFVRALKLIMDSRRLALEIQRILNFHKFDYILIDCFREYFSPFWIGPLKKIAKVGARFGVVSHDPVRDFVLGPIWWHKFSIRCSYSFVSDVFVHDAEKIDFGGPKPAQIKVHVIPHGPYTYPSPHKIPSVLREQFGYSRRDYVILSFGHIRDGKNLDQFIRALAVLPDQFKLLVVGSGGANSQKPPSYYMELADRVGVADRCQWILQYIDEEDITSYFAASDAVLLTYSKAFVSASGVLSIAMEMEKPVIASGGEGPLFHLVKNYPVGIWVDAVDVQSLAVAAQQIADPTRFFSFGKIRRDYSWEENARIILGAISTHV